MPNFLMQQYSNMLRHADSSASAARVQPTIEDGPHGVGCTCGKDGVEIVLVKVEGSRKGKGKEKGKSKITICKPEDRKMSKNSGPGSPKEDSDLMKELKELLSPPSESPTSPKSPERPKSPGLQPPPSPRMRSREPSRERCTAVNVRHILCSNFSKAKEALAKIREDGQRFDEVAAKYSEDRAKVGGSMGWMSKGSFQEQSALEKAAFELEPSTLDDPIVSNLIITNYGYHIILVEGRR